MEILEEVGWGLKLAEKLKKSSCLRKKAEIGCELSTRKLEKRQLYMWYSRRTRPGKADRLGHVVLGIQVGTLRLDKSQKEDLKPSEMRKAHMSVCVCVCVYAHRKFGSCYVMQLCFCSRLFLKNVRQNAHKILHPSVKTVKSST